MEENGTWERTFVLVKPDGVVRGLVGTIMARFERVGLTFTAMKMTSVSKEHAEKHYEEHRGQSFFEPLVKLLVSAPVVLMAVEGANAISVVRKIVGGTEPSKAAPGTIRGDFCHMDYARSKEQLGVIPNLIHASDSRESAQREIGLWFDKTDFASHYERVESRLM